MPWDKESAAAAGRKGAEARKRKADLTPEERALDAIARKLPRLTEELISAALGEDDFTELKLETRVSALKTLMEWKLGRPASVKPQTGDDPQEAGIQSPEDLFQ